MQAVVAQALRACSRTLPAKSLASRVALSIPRRGFLIVPSYKSRIAVAYRGYATATATKKPAAKKATATTTKKTTTRKKAVATKSATKTKPKAKKAVKKTAVAKPKVKKRELTPEEKATAEKRQLKRDSLKSEQPSKLPYSSWLVYCLEQSKGKSLGKNLGATVKTIAENFKKLSPSERERLAAEATQNHLKNIAGFKKWVESHPIDVIKRANRARSKLDRQYQVRYTPMRIPDERNPKKPRSPFALYISAHSHEGTNGSASLITTMSEQWRSLGETEKKSYFDLAAAERTKFTQEYGQPQA